MNGLKKILSRQKTSQSGDHEGELQAFRKQHRYDPFLEDDKLRAVDSALDSGNAEKLRDLDNALIQDDSPYPEVRAAVPNTDEDMPVDTIRAWVIGGLLCTIVSACNVLLALRRTPISISSTVVQLVAYPLGCFWARVMPAKTFHLFGRTFELNPGPFNVKEHTIITMMTAAGSAISYAFDILLAQEVFYDQHFKWGFQILLVLSTQAMGFGIAGISRRFLIYPSSMVWPATLVTCAVMYALHNHQPADPATTNGWKIGRYAFFLIVSMSTFVWEWVPQVFAQFLQFFNFACWIAPNNVIVNQVLGAQSGLGLIPISFDWSIVSAFLGSPLQAPAFSLVNVALGLALLTIAASGLSWGGPEFYRYLPISANTNYDHFAKKYNTSRILTPQFTMNETAYREYSPILISPTFTLSYGMSFAALISTLVHVALFYGPDIWRRSRDMRSEEPDVHLKLMRKYKEAPEWWFLAIFALSFAFGMIASQVWPTHLPWWAFIICIAIGLVFFIPVGTVQAITNQQTGLNVITELVIGFMLPGRPIAMMMFKCWGYMIVFYGLNYISDMKIGHYMKIPPRSMFAAQAFAVIWLSIVQVATYNFLLGNIKGICTEDQAQGLTCPAARTFFNASVIWGVIGPAKMFGAGQLFSWLNWFWLIGAALPVIQYFITRRNPRSIFRYMLTPVIFGAAGQIPPATLYYLWQFVTVGLVFNWFLRRRYFGWWQQYNYTLSGALDIGNALASVVIGLALGLGNANFPDWWGNTVPYTNLDGWHNATTKVFHKGQTPLGPATWS
ncbi:small oligopeptide transporter, OPT family [Cordyceps fumosorosea ARSEF 2679]|uniref:Small oligopeptide transporter, OPT family n=1 Tax=Cordyceps fumosorosea (strain ARSEF 2679) TaxID=1081104 RepID=A0A168D9J7_CORFA|nr:small oligopeptide transporter, OPT family [Cordyceps fumosorosea ARSEF 2679]OAA72327.1 small oligopeptide transporter, OPT family [Cordyceps fumosorosea ARSEF 2679]